MRWRDSVLAALHRFAVRHGSRNIERQTFLEEELSRISAEVATRGRTPHQTISRVLQELRDEGLIEFISSGSYLLTDQPIDVETEDLPDEAIDVALQRNLLRLGHVSTGTDQALVRIRRGQARVRALTVSNYRELCAVCDVSERPLLVASHVVTWSEAPQHRGNLANVICLCRFHDALFEHGYWSLSDDLTILKRRSVGSTTIRMLLDVAIDFRRPIAYPPSVDLLANHRRRVGLPE
jgi:hypothetical protein